MRTFNSISILASVLMLSIAVSCKKETPEPSKIELSATEVSLTKIGKDANESSAAVVVTSNVYWRAFIQDDCDWLILSRAGGPDGETELLITAVSNLDGAKRAAKVVFEPLEGESVTLTVYQDGADGTLNIISDQFGSAREKDVEFTSGLGTATGLSYATFKYDGYGTYLSSEQPSSGYENASGEGNLLLPAGSNMGLCYLDYHYGLQYVLTFGLWMEDNEALDYFRIVASTDGESFTTLPYTTEFDASGWRLVKVYFDFDEIQEYGWIRIFNNYFSDMRIDDIVMTETTFADEDYSHMDITGRDWSAGDRVSIFDDKFQHEFRYSDGAFSAISKVHGDKTVALYPADPDAIIAASSLSAILPDSYKYNPLTESPAEIYAGIGTAAAVELTPICGKIRAKFVKTNATLEEVSVDVVDGPAIAGDCFIDLETFKPEFYDETGKTVTVSFTDPIDITKNEATVDIPLPAGEYNSLRLTVTDIQGNQTLMDLSNVTIVSGEAYEVSIKCEDASVVNMNMPSYYGESGATKVYANCYRVSEPGKYKFECRKPDGTFVSGAEGTWVWATTGVWDYEEQADYTDIITDLSWDGKYFYFTVDENATYGNVFVAVLDEDGYILYSWHIWTTENPSDISFGGYQWMDRNIGASYRFNSTDKAVCRASRGFFYGWGSRVAIVGTLDWNSKTGFVQGTSATYYCYNSDVKNTGIWAPLTAFPDSWTGSGEDVASYPMSTISDNTKFSNIASSDSWKTINDPCPYGYHVMTFAEASELGKVTLSVVKDTEGTNVNVACKFDNLELPSCGYRNSTTGVMAYANNPDGRYWTSQTLSSDNAKGSYWLMNASNNKTNSAGKNVGMSVRCVKNHN